MQSANLMAEYLRFFDRKTNLYRYITETAQVRFLELFTFIVNLKILLLIFFDHFEKFPSSNYYMHVFQVFYSQLAFLFASESSGLLKLAKNGTFSFYG